MIVHALKSIQISNNNTYWVHAQTNYRNSEYCKSEFWFSDSPDIGISKKNPIGIFGIKNRIGIPLTMGVPEIRTNNRNSQPSGALGGHIRRRRPWSAMVVLVNDGSWRLTSDQPTVGIVKIVYGWIFFNSYLDPIYSWHLTPQLNKEDVDLLTFAFSWFLCPVFYGNRTIFFSWAKWCNTLASHFITQRWLWLLSLYRYL